MALKAGRVGVAPSEVDAFGHIIGGDVPSNILTTDDIVDNITTDDANKPLSAKQGRYLGQRLYANGQVFYFAYDAATDRYGWKNGQSGTFHPFSSGVSESGIYVANPVQTGMNAYTGTEIVSGGYEKVGKYTYFDVTIKILTADKTADSNLVSLYSASTGNNWLLIDNDKVKFESGDIRAKGTLSANEEITFKAIRW